MTEDITTTSPIHDRSAGLDRRRLGQLRQQLATSNLIWRMAQLGYAAKGLLYVIVGGTALLAVLSMGRRVRGTSGALNFLLASPFGRLGVAVVGVGLCGFILRRFVQVFVSPTVGKPPGPITRMLRRFGCALSGLGHLGVALTALEVALGIRGFSISNTTRMLNPMLPTSELLGVSVIRVVGLVIVGFALFQFYLALTRRFTVDLQEDQMSDGVKRMTHALGIVGHFGRGVAFLISGGFLVYAGWFVPEIETGGLGQTLRALKDAPFGLYVFFAVTAGLTAYGLYLLMAALYLRLIPRW